MVGDRLPGEFIPVQREEFSALLNMNKTKTDPFVLFDHIVTAGMGVACIMAGVFALPFSYVGYPTLALMLFKSLRRK